MLICSKSWKFVSVNFRNIYIGWFHIITVNILTDTIDWEIIACTDVGFDKGNIEKKRLYLFATCIPIQITDEFGTLFGGIKEREAEYSKKNMILLDNKREIFKIGENFKCDSGLADSI